MAYPPTPTSLKLVMGNPGKRPLPENEPIPEGEVVRPAFVKGRALKLWEQYAPKLIAQGVLTSWDVDMFAAWCVLMGQFQKDPEGFTSAKIAQMRSLAGAFGLTAADRARIKVKPQESKSDPASKYLTRPS